MRAVRPTTIYRPPRFRGLIAAVACLCLLPPGAESVGSALIVHNVIYAPHPSSPVPVRLARKDPLKVNPVKVTPNPAPVAPSPRPRPSLPAATAASHVREEVAMARHALHRLSKPEEQPTLADVFLGSNDSDSSKPRIRIGYGRMVADHSETDGWRREINWEEPQCFYVKTTVRF